MNDRLGQVGPPRPRVAHRALSRRGFTVVEMLIVVTIIGIIGMLALPSAASLRLPRLKTAADMLAADLEFAQSECVHDPSNLRVMRFDTTNNAYWLALASAPATPLTYPGDGQPYNNDFSTGRYVTLSGVTLTSISGVSTSPWTLAFDGYGQPQVSSDVTFTLSADGHSITVTITAATGDVSIGTMH